MFYLFEYFLLTFIPQVCFMTYLSSFPGNFKAGTGGVTTELRVSQHGAYRPVSLLTAQPETPGVRCTCTLTLMWRCSNTVSPEAPTHR